MLEQRKYLEKVIGAAYGNHTDVDKFLDSLLDNLESGPAHLVNVTDFSIALSMFRDSCQAALQAIADELQAQRRLHNDKITNPRTGEKY